MAKDLLSLEAHTRGKYVLLLIISNHLPVTSLLDLGTCLPQEVMTVMGHQTLSCHVCMHVGDSMISYTFIP